MNYKNFTVLLSVYYKENPKYLKDSIESIYHKQTVKPNEIILILDGKLTPELYATIEDIQKGIDDQILKIIELEQNMGLGNALKIGVEESSNDIIARMDTDDIAYPSRFEKQLDYLNKHKDVDIVGTYMNEFCDSVENIVCVKDAPPREKIAEYIKMRSPLNHPTVMMKKYSVINSGNYSSDFLAEDYELWGRMFAHNCIFDNIPEILLYFRTTDDTYKRRGGIKDIKAEYLIQKELYSLKIINRYEFIRNMILKGTIKILPNKLRKIIYLNFLRQKKDAL